MKVYLTQYLCPERHAIAAFAFVSEEADLQTKTGTVEKQMGESLQELKVNPWCGLCGSTALSYETKPTKYTTIEEALPALYEEARKQKLTRAALYATGESYESSHDRRQRN